YARDIAALPTGAAQLVVLASCSTARGKAWQIEGMIRIARAFLASGVPMVLATRWPVEDEATAAFMARFHTDIARGIPPQEALRRAQLSFLSGPVWRRSPTAWAAFELIGGVP